MRNVEWRRFTGDISNVAISGGDVPTVGVGPDICHCCDERRVLIACIGDEGHEVNVGVSPEEAFKIADAIRDAALKVARTAGAS